MVVAETMPSAAAVLRTLLRLDDRERLFDGVQRMAVAGHAGRTARIDVLGEDSTGPRRDAASDAGSCLDLPVEVDGVEVGVLAVTASQPHAFDAAEQERLVGLAEDLGLALERLQVRERLEAAERRREETWAEGAEGTFRTCVDGRILAVNPAFAALAGYESPEALLAEVEHVRELYADPADRDRLITELGHDGTVTDRDLRLRRRDGRTTWVSLTARLARGSEMYTLEGVLVDIDERKRAEQQLHEALQQMARREAMLEALSRNAQVLLGSTNLQEAVPQMMASVAAAADASRVSLFINDRDADGRVTASRHFPWVAPGEVDTLAGNPQLACLDYEAAGIGSWAATFAAERCVAGLTTEFDDAPRAFLEALDVYSMGAAPVMVDGGWWGVLVFDVVGEARAWNAAELDVLHATARMLGTAVEREQVQATRAQLAAIVETSSDAIITRAPDGTIRTWNAGAEQVYGYPAAEAIGRHISLLVPADHAEDLDNVMGVAAGGLAVTGYETERVRADGTRPQVSITAAPVKDDSGGVIAVASIERDVSTEVVARQELARSNAELEQFAYVASHDLQEPLRMVTSFVQLLHRRYADQLDETAVGYIDFAVDGATRMQQLINDLLTFSRVATRARPFEPVDLGGMVRQVLDDLNAAVDDAGATIEVGELPTVHGDPVQLRQVLQNLLANAVKFRVSGHRPHVDVAARQGADGYWDISVTDDGIGIDPAHAERVFMIFKRLHSREEYGGTGLGLAISKKITERHGGRLWFDSQPGAGATFHLSLPTRPGEA